MVAGLAAKNSIVGAPLQDGTGVGTTAVGTTAVGRSGVTVTGTTTVTGGAVITTAVGGGVAVTTNGVWVG